MRPDAPQTMSHDNLAISLAAHLRTDRRMTWCDMQLGPSGSVRPDVYTLFTSYSNPCPMAYEVKVSTADFRSDVTAGKWQAYLKHACGVYFACEGDLIAKGDVPAHCGLMVYRNTWRIAKKATLSPVTIPQDTAMKLLIDGLRRDGPQYLRRSWSESLGMATVRSKFGGIVAETVQDRLAVEYEIEQSKHTARRIEEDARSRADKLLSHTREALEPIRAELLEALGLSETVSNYDIKYAVRRLRESQREHPAVEKLRTLTQSLRHVLERDGYVEAPEMETEEVWRAP